MAPEGSTALAPVRAVVFARRSGAALRSPRPREGVVALTLAAAVTRGSGEAAAAVVASRLDAALLADLARTLEWEPAGPADDTFPDWIRELGRDRAADAIHRERAGVDRSQYLARGGGEGWRASRTRAVARPLARRAADHDRGRAILFALLRTARAPR
jgi:hypothetical protein